mgnify:CR=1 FL=1
MLIEMPLDLVATVSFFRARDCASSKAYFITRSVPKRANTDCCSTVSYTHLRAHETVLAIVCRLLPDTKNHLTI